MVRVQRDLDRVLRGDHVGVLGERRRPRDGEVPFGARGRGSQREPYEGDPGRRRPVPVELDPAFRHRDRVEAILASERRLDEAADRELNRDELERELDRIEQEIAAPEP